MKTIPALIVLIIVLVWGWGITQCISAKQDFYHCIKLYADEVLTDTEVQDLNDKCEASSGYTQELLP
jgi:hypothetical protein